MRPSSSHKLDRAEDPPRQSQIPRHQRHRDTHRLHHQRRSHGEEDHRGREHPSQHGRHNVRNVEKLSQVELAEQLNAAPNETKYFAEDRRGDPFNLTYGNLHRYSVPRYRTAGHGRVLGLPRNYKLIHDREHDTRVLISGFSDFGTRDKGKSLLSTTSNSEHLVSHVVAKNVFSLEHVAGQDYLPLATHSARKRRQIPRSSSRSSLPEHQSDIIKHEKTAEPISEAPPQSETGSSESDSGGKARHDLEVPFEDFRQSAQQQRHVELLRAVHDRPQDIQAWIDLIYHQDVMLDTEQDVGKRAHSSAQKRGLADIKLSMFEQALSKVKAHPQRDRLVLGLMEEGLKIWDAKKVSSEWRSMLKNNPGSLDLWRAYLDFQQASFITFTYEQCKSAYTECLGLVNGQPPSMERDRIQVYLTSRLTVFMRQAGFSELATAIWEALLEYCFYQPLDVPCSDLASFGQFWDSEVARIGEERATGWRSAVPAEVQSKADVFEANAGADHTFEAWANAERERMLVSKLPARTLDDVAEDDPYRVIIFSDVKDYLFRLLTAGGVTLLLNAFLSFCGLPPLASEDGGNSQMWWADPFLRDDLQQILSIQQKNSERIDPFTNSVAPYLMVGTASLFANYETWFGAWGEDPCSSVAGLDVTWRRLALRQLVDGLVDHDQLTEYVVAFELKINPKAARSYAKALLKKRPSSLLLYNAFALIEARSGNFEAARRVWSTALSMSKTLSEPEQRNTVLLWQSWIWELLNARLFQEARYVLLSMPQGAIRVDGVSESSTATSVDSANILQCQRHLETLLSQSLSFHHTIAAAHYTELLSLLSYLSTDRTLSEGMSIYSNVLDGPYVQSNPTSTLSELLHQSRARLLHLHATSSPASGYRPSDISLPIAESIKLFPSNTIFLSLYHHHTQRAILMDRIRSTIPTLKSTLDRAEDRGKKSTIPYIFDVWTELNRPSYAGSTTNSIRAAFERAVDIGAAGRHCVAIWKYYLLWELSLVPIPTSSTSTSTNSTSINSNRIKKGKSANAPQEPLARAQDVFYRALRACPWAKELYMLAFSEEKLRDAIGFDGLRRVYETMSEKGLRIHVDLGDLLEEWDERGKKKKMGDCG